MLIRFVITNFLSFNEEREFNMIAGAFKTHKHHVYNAGKIDVLKAAAIYGANGAGKSNFIKALEFLKEIISDGTIKHSVNNKKFKLNKENVNKPSTFEIEFSIEKKIYIYGVSIQHLSVVEEWLYESGVNIDDKLLFERKQSKSGKPVIKMSPKYVKTKKSQLLIELFKDNLLKSNELFLGKTDSLKIKEILQVRNWFEYHLIVIHPRSKFQGLVPVIATSDTFKSFANDLLQTFDTGVTELGTEDIDFDKFFGDDDEKLKNELVEAFDDSNYIILDSDVGNVLISKEEEKFIVKKVIALHKDNKGVNVPFDLTDESEGTQRLLDFIPAFDRMLKEDVTFIIDEIDQSLHPTLLRALVNKIMSDQQTKGQFIFTTHESNLLDLELFRQDEVWFVEKNKNTGSTEMYSLSEFKPRYDLDIRKGYLQGRFGAIPFLAHLMDLNWHKYGI